MAQAIATLTTDHDALQSLLAGPVTLHTSVSELSRTWGWNRMRVLRRLRKWSDDGLITRDIDETSGRSTITIVKTTVETVTIDVPVGSNYLPDPDPTPARPVFT